MKTAGESRNNHRYAVVVQDLATQWIQSYPCKKKTSQETERSSRKFLQPSEQLKVIYCDNSWNLAHSVKIYHGITELQHLLDLRRTVLLTQCKRRNINSIVAIHLGPKKWWVDSMECNCYLRNVQDLLADGKTPHARGFGEPFKGSVIPFGAMVEYYPIPSRDQSRPHQCGKKVLPGIFLGYELIAEGIWKGDILVADIEELEKMTHWKFTLEESMRKKY